MNILASCIGRRGYLAEMLRAHLRPGERIVGTSNTAMTPGFRRCDRVALMPDIASPGYPDAVLELVRREEIGALLSFFDPDLDALAPHRDRLRAAGAVPFLPSPEVSRACLDKAMTPAFLAARGLAAPRTWTAVDEVLAAIEAGTLAWPVVVKDRFGFGSRHLGVAHTALQLRAWAEAAGEPVLQERLSGREHSFDLLNDLEGRCVRAVVKRKLAMRSGETDAAITVRDERLEAIAFHLGDHLDHAGPADVDLFVDHDGAVTILEINPRFGGGYPASHLAGADFPGLVVAMARGERVARVEGGYQPDVLMFKDVVAFSGAELDRVPRVVAG